MRRGFLLLTLAILSVGCSSLSFRVDPTGGVCPQTSIANGAKILAGGDAADRAIVFVHGFTGTSRSFLRWACLIHREQASASTQYDLLLFQYPTGLIGCPETLDSAADALGRFLAQPEVSRYRELLFVPHSFGGLVTLRYVANDLSSDRRSLLQGTKILLLGVPLDGAEIAKWGKRLNCQAAAAHIGSQELTKLHNDLVQAVVHPAQGVSSAEAPVDIWSLVAAADDIVAANESLLREMPIKTQKIVSIRSESGDVPATHSSLIQVLTPTIRPIWSFVS